MCIDTEELGKPFPFKRKLYFLLQKQLMKKMVQHSSILWHWLVGHEVKISMTYISQSSDLVLHLEDYLMYKHHSSGLWVSTTRCLTSNVGHCDLYFIVHWFCLISRRLFDVGASYFRIISQYDPLFDLKMNVGLCDLYFMVLWFCLMSWRLLDIWTSFCGLWVSMAQHLTSK